MKYLKILISTLIIITILLSLTAGVFAADEEKTFDVTYREFNLYRSIVNYIKEYPITYNGYEVLEGNSSYDVEVKINGKLFKKDDTKIFDGTGKCDIKVFKGTTVFKTITSPLAVNENKIDVEFKNLMGVNCKYQFSISVKEENTDKIDENTFDWVKVEKPVLKWVNELKYGPYMNTLKKTINLGDTEEYTTSKDVYGKGKVFYFLNGKPSNLYFTGNNKLILGENKLYTKNILFKQVLSDRKCMLNWFKVEFIIDLNIHNETTPEVTNTPKINTSPEPETTNNNLPEEFPNTGEGNPIFFIIIGCIIIAAGCIIFINRDKIIKVKN